MKRDRSDSKGFCGGEDKNYARQSAAAVPLPPKTQVGNRHPDSIVPEATAVKKIPTIPGRQDDPGRQATLQSLSTPNLAPRSHPGDPAGLTQGVRVTAILQQKLPMPDSALPRRG